MWTSLNKKMYLLLGVIFMIGLIIGTIFVVSLDEDVKEIVLLNINELLQSKISINNILIHLVILSSILILSILLVGAPLIMFYLFYHGFSTGFTIFSLMLIFGLKGVFYGLIYFIVSKLIFTIILFIISTNLFKLIKSIIDHYVYKIDNIKNRYLLIKRCIIFIGLILVNDVILYTFGGKVMSIFSFLIK